ncbi:MAG: ABC transporter permease, partial [Alphaproteobacteria bacterium]|nr:ABC transporter permease [Alphaproteobacteria bacterium]
IYRDFEEQLTKPLPEKIIINAINLKSWDSTLAIFITDIYKITKQKNINIENKNFSQDLITLLSLVNKPQIKPSIPKVKKLDFLSNIGNSFLILITKIKDVLKFLKQTLLSIGRTINGTVVMRPIDFFFALDDCGPKAIGIVSLISFMVGLILAFVGAIQLKLFGAEIYIATLVSIGMTRIMGAIMTGIIMAGRTGSSYAATIGTMQVNEELDAMKTMGISRIDFLLIPRLLALTIAMPFLTILSDIMGIIGGGFVGIILLDIPCLEYLKYTTQSFTTTNFLVGLFHGLAYAIIIALCGCYYGLNCGRDADSVGQTTTKAVVSSIVWMIVIT